MKLGNRYILVEMKSTCDECGEEYNKGSMRHFYNQTLCPPCHKTAMDDEAVEDGVSHRDYIDQNPMEVPNA
jgi:hypothetical protein